MRRHLKVLWLLALFCAPPFTLAQTGAGWEHALVPHLPGVSSRHGGPIQVTNDQRLDLAHCSTTAKQVAMIVDQMTRVGTPWGRGHLNYSRHDLTVLSDREQALDTALVALTTTHEDLRKNLGELHDRTIEKRLQKLDRLQAKLYSDRTQISRDLAAPRPGPGSPELSWDVYALRKSAHKWQAEHEQIARELELAM